MDFLPYIVAVLVLAFLGFQIYPWFKLRAARGQRAPDLDKLLDPEQQGLDRLLLYFMAPQCGMCKNITPVVDQLADERSDILRIDASEHPEIAREFRVMGTPAFVLVNAGLIENVKLGGLTRKGILRMLDASH